MPGKSDRAREVKRRGQSTVRGDRRKWRGMRKHLVENAKKWGRKRSDFRRWGRRKRVRRA